MRVPIHPIGFATNTWHAVDTSVLVNLEGGSTHDPFTINSWHGSHLVHWMLKAHQPSFTMEHASCTFIMYQQSLTFLFEWVKHNPVQ